MTRRSGLLRSIAQAQREAERKRQAQARAQTQAAKAAAQAQKAYERAQIADQKERARLYAESRTAYVAELNDELDSDVTLLNNLLLEALPIDSFIDFHKLKET